jgi:hypothetical protein
MSCQRLETFAISGIPHADGVILTSADNGGAVGTEDYSSHVARMPLQPMQDAPTHNIPEQNDAVISTTGEQIACGMEGD